MDLPPPRKELSLPNPFPLTPSCFHVSVVVLALDKAGSKRQVSLFETQSVILLPCLWLSPPSLLLLFLTPRPWTSLSLSLFPQGRKRRAKDPLTSSSGSQTEREEGAKNMAGFPHTQEIRSGRKSKIGLGFMGRRRAWRIFILRAIWKQKGGGRGN